MKKYSHLLPNESEIELMLKASGHNSIDELYSDVPPEVMEDAPLNIPGPLTQMEIERKIGKILSTDGASQDNPPFLGGGIWPHYVPPAVRMIISRSEFYTSYTPYQAEVSQGILQALFEFQSLICDLMKMDAANASMYDWPSAAAEACRMAMRYKGRKRVLLASNSGFERRSVISTYLRGAGVEPEEVGFDPVTGLLDEGELEQKIGEDVAALYVEHPNFFGCVETGIKRIERIVHEKGALLIVGVEPTSLGILTPPGEYGADIAVGEGQPLGIPMNYGGPSLGLFAARGDLAFIRQMPGRIIGMTTEKGGDRRGFAMVLQTREQHIRRERATSNICTNQSLMAVAAAAYLSLLGSEGVRKLAKVITSNAHYTVKRINEVGKYEVPYFKGEFYSDFTVKQTTGKHGSELFNSLRSMNLFGGVPLSWFYKGYEDISLFSVTEVHTKDDVDRLVEALRKVA